MQIKKFDIFSANLSPRYGTEPGKIRPVVVIQTDLLNNEHPSTIVCPITTHVIQKAMMLRVHLSPEETGLASNSDVMVDQIRAIDNRRLKQRIGHLSTEHQEQLVRNLKIVVLE